MVVAPLLELFVLLRNFIVFLSHAVGNGDAFDVRSTSVVLGPVVVIGTADVYLTLRREL